MAHNEDLDTQSFTDPSDKASFTESLARAAAIAAVSNRPKRTPKKPGECDWCGEPTKDKSHLFCSLDCRDDEEQHTKRLLIAGRQY